MRSQIRMKVLVKNFVLLLSVIFVLAACGGDDPPPPTSAPVAGQAAQAAPVGDAAKGKRLFTATCSACHGPNAEGVRGLGKDMTHSEFIAGLSDQELLALSA